MGSQVLLPALSLEASRTPVRKNSQPWEWPAGISSRRHKVRQELLSRPLRTLSWMAKSGIGSAV